MSLNRLLEMQRAKQSESAAPASIPSASPFKEPAVDAAPQESGTDEAIAPAESAPAPAPNPKRLPFGNNAPKPATPAPTPKPKAEKVEFDLDNMANFDLSSVDEVESPDPAEFSGFFDEIEATAPDRDLSPDLTPGQLGFVESLDSIYLILNDSDMFAQSVRTIMMELQENPEYLQLVSDTDVHVMIRAMRNTMGLARIRKQQKQRKTGTGKSRAPSKKQALMDKALGLSIGMDID